MVNFKSLLLRGNYDNSIVIIANNVIIHFPKKGDLSLMTNNRGITLMLIAAKVYNKIPLRIRDHASLNMYKGKKTNLDSVMVEVVCSKYTPCKGL